MMFTVTLEAQTAEPLTEAQIEAVTELGGVSSGNVDGRTIGATMTQEGENAIAATDASVGRFTRALDAAFTLVGAEAITIEEFDARQQQWEDLVVARK